jgi:hypothetical protein
MKSRKKSRATLAGVGPSPTAMLQTRYVDTVAAAEHIGVSASFLEKRRCTGDGPPFLKIGARVMYRLTDLDAWLSGQARTNTISR